MNAKILVRIAGISMLLHTVGHTIGALTWKKGPDADSDSSYSVRTVCIDS